MNSCESIWLAPPISSFHGSRKLRKKYQTTVVPLACPSSCPSLPEIVRLCSPMPIYLTPPLPTPPPLPLLHSPLPFFSLLLPLVAHSLPRSLTPYPLPPRRLCHTGAPHCTPCAPCPSHANDSDMTRQGTMLAVSESLPWTPPCPSHYAQPWQTPPQR